MSAFIHDSSGAWGRGKRIGGLAALRPAGLRRGFTLLEILVVVTIISVLAMLAVPAFARIQRRAKTTTVMNDFRVFATAFVAYSQENGTWPAEAAVGVIPTGMSSQLNNTAWKRTTPMGGKYNWDYNQLHFGVRYQAAIGISTAAGATLVLNVPQLQDLERTIDKGNFNWTGGDFHLGSGLIPLFIVQP